MLKTLNNFIPTQAFLLLRMDQNTFKKDFIHVQRLGHIAIRVNNVERAKDFYIRLGMKLIWDDPDWCYLEAGPSKDGLALLGPGYKAAGAHFAFHFTDRNEVKLMHHQLKESGIAVGSLHDHRDGTSSFYLRDPEGNWLEMLYQPPSGIPTNQSDD